MNTRSFEKQLQQMEAPPPDPRARLRARHAAVAEFERVHKIRRSRHSRTWLLPRTWVGALGTACVVVMAVSLFWMVPAPQRELATQAIKVEMLGETPESSPPSAIMAPPTVLMDLPVDPAIPARKAEPPQQPPPAELRRYASDDHGGAASGAVAMAPAALIAETSAEPLPAPPPPAPPAFQREEKLSAAQATGSRVASAAADRATQPPAAKARSRGDELAADALAANALLMPVPQGLVSPPGGDQFRQVEVNPVKRTADEPVSTFSIDVDTASYSFVRRQLNEGVPPPADAVRAEEMINYFDYAWPAADSRRVPFKATVAVSDSPWAEGRKLVHIGIKGYELPASRRPDVNLVLLLDVSGSMNAPDKLPLVKRSMKLLLDSLKPADTVAIVVYAGAAGQVLAPTPVRDRSSIEDALDSLQPGGSTAGAQGIQLAYQLAERNFRKDGVNRILLATDGDFNVGTSNPDELKRLVERERGKGVFLSVLGFGEGNYRDDIAQVLAQNGNGVAAYIDSLGEARKVLVQQASAQLFTIAKDVKLQVEFNPATVAEYRLVGYETRALNREDFNNDRVDAGDIGAGHTVTAIYEITPVGSRPLIDERRYGTDQPAAARGKPDEYGFLKIRYKLPGEEQSRLLEQPISVDAGVPSAVRQDVQFATAVAGFAQLLQGGRYTGALDYDDVYRAAQGSLGRDPFGYRAEFLQLVRRAQRAGRERER